MLENDSYVLGLSVVVLRTLKVRGPGDSRICIVLPVGCACFWIPLWCMVKCSLASACLEAGAKSEAPFSTECEWGLRCQVYPDLQLSIAATLVGHLLCDKMWCQTIAWTVISFNTITLQNRCFIPIFQMRTMSLRQRKWLQTVVWSFSVHQNHPQCLLKHSLRVGWLVGW